jgi:hypothetical protein
VTFYIEHITNPVISVKKIAKQEDEVNQLGPNKGVRSVIANPSVAQSGTEVC